MSQRIEEEKPDKELSYVDKIVMQTRAREAEVVKDFGKFDLYYQQTPRPYYSNTIIHHKDCTIASCGLGRIYIRSEKNDRCLVFDGAGGEGCTQITVKNDVLYQACIDGSKKGLLMYQFDLETLEWNNHD